MKVIPEQNLQDLMKNKKVYLYIRGKMHRSFIWILFAVLSFSCATSGSSDLNEISIAIKSASSGDEIVPVVNKAFSADYNLKGIESSVKELLVKYPENGELNEIAAFNAMLKSEKGKAFSHLIRSVLDSENRNIPLMLELVFSMNLTANERKVFIRTLEILVSNSKDDNVKQLSRNILTHYYLLEGIPEKAAFETDSNGFIRNWWIIGGFDNDNGKGFYDEYGPEKELDIKKTYKGKVVNVGWRKIRFNGHKGFVPFDSFVSPSNDSLAYMLANIFSPVDKDVILNVSTSDAIKVWVNGSIVFAEENISHFGYDNVRVKVKLFKGENTILFKTCQKTDVWSVGARITEISEKESTDLVALHNFPKDSGKKTFESQIIFPYSEKEPVSEDLKETLYKGLILNFKGYEKYSMNYIRTAYEKAPHNPLIMLYMAKALNVAGEEGKYIDLLNGAINHSFSELASFLIMRGRFFAKKGQKESAEEDYKKALESNPSSVEALKSQAGLFQSKGWHEDSRRILRKALEIEPDSPSLLKLLAASTNRLNYKEDAERIYRKALKLFPGDVSLNEELFHISRERRSGSSALYFLERIIDLSPYNIRAYFDLFEFYRSSKDIDNALHQLEIIKNINPDNSKIHIKEGDLFYEQNKIPQALASWEKAHQLDPKNSYISERISYLKIEEKDESEKYVPDDDKIMEIIKNSIDFAADDGAETLLVYDHAVCRINSDGSSKWYITEVSRALNDAGRDSLINSYLPYDGRKRILKTYSVNSNFEKSEASSVSSFDIRFRQLKKGDFTVIQYIHYKPAPVFLENDFVGQWFVQSPMKHVIYSEWNLIYPEGTKLNIDITGSRTEQVLEKLNDLTVHRFIARNIEPLNYEPNSPPLNNFLETVTVSTSESWDKYVNWERALLKDAFVSAKEIRDKAVKIVEGEQSVIGKINKIFEFVAQDIRYQQEYENTIAGVKPHTAAQTLERGYGDCKDKAILFIQLAKELNIKVDYVIVRTRNTGTLQKTIPNQQFNHAIVYIPSQEGVESGFFMDPTVDLLEIGSLREDDQGATALKLDIGTGKYEFIDIPYQSPELNFQKHDRVYNLSSEGTLKVNDSISMRGGTSSYFRQTLRTKDVGQKMFQRIANSLFKGGVLDKYEHSDIEDITSPFNISFSADVTNLVSVSGGKMTVSMPEQIVNASIITLEKRKLPLWTGIPNLYEINVKFEIPEGFIVESMPNDISISNDCFSIIRTSTIIDERNVAIKSVFMKNCTEISVENYPQFRKLILEVIKKHNEYLVLVRK